MNYLAHLHLADTVGSHLGANLLADYIKGAPSTDLVPAVYQGIRFHRFVDAYADSHKVTRQAKLLFEPQLRRYASIALDVIWDHFLAQHWRQFSAVSLIQFATIAEQQITTFNNGTLPKAYLDMQSRMWSQQWLLGYQDPNNICRALDGIAKRRPKLAAIAQCQRGFSKHYDALDIAFLEFYPELIAASRRQCQASASPLNKDWR